MRVISLDRLTASQFDASLAARRGFDAKVDPGLPEITAAEWQAYLAVESLNDEDRIHYGASDDDRMVGLGHLGLKRSPENRHQASCEIDGISEAGETLLGVICDAATGAGGTWTVRPPERGDRRVRPPPHRNAA